MIVILFQLFAAQARSGPVCGLESLDRVMPLGPARVLVFDASHHSFGWACTIFKLQSWAVLTELCHAILHGILCKRPFELHQISEENE